ncbi:MAG: polysaccharide biosynthesis tyrosine autokinase [Moraxellaceae bacterium]|jgi:succinoglycan biosynthesis transport protein ExoP|nr:polysaccharide biosynthesis tyrosine autokinase [Moraxellaceae bacterium]MBP7228966.1 polysaccharide biosynthesis tyrosine autokinase [Moraxellaceae bacterium]MBP8851643.1 polysaccharide biosynthesis tyrosine autokinase [Moraxellaceae bacterium]MBP9045127.1 polysaccharide biosynthesis tyrosine autokinase [Moraxellaceae bacterium]MBP9729882.1 polysaccharide biosynthesis tyrosine autokinase [Moraxellaceae bacterium]
MDKLAGPLAGTSPEQEQEIDLRQYWRIVSRYKWGILGLAIAITVLATLIVFSMDPVYRSTVTLLIEQKQAKVITIEEVYGLDGSNKEYLQTQFEILKSRELAARVVRELKLETHPEFAPQEETKQETDQTSFKLDWRFLLPKGHQKNPSISDDEKFNRIVDRFSANLTVAPVRNTQLVKISFESFDKALAARVANAMAYAYINSQMEARIAVTEQAAAWLTVRMSSLKTSLDASEQKLQAYREQNDLVKTGDVEGVLALTAKQLQDLSERQIQAQFKLSEISKRYGPKHPSYLQAQYELDEADIALRQARKNAMVVARKEFRLQELMREVETNRNLYDTFFTRIKEANQTRQLETSNARVVDPAVVSSIPVKPNKKLTMALAFVLSLMLGVLLAFLLDYLDSTFKGAEDVEARLGVPMLGLLPLAKSKTKSNFAQATFLEEGMQSFAEAMRTIRTGVILSSIDAPHQIVVVTSSVPGEGKTTTSLNLALAMGQMERVLLIDADMRRPSVAKACNIPAASPGLSNLVAGSADMSQCIHHLEDGNIDVLTAGLIPPNPLELLSSKRFKEVLNQLLEKYDRIVIDSAPTLAVSDALVLASLANAVIYVVKSDSTAFHSARTGIQRLQRVNAPLAGVVLNQVNFSKANKYGSYYGYYDYYGTKAD